jgi:hypothetical protein
MVKNSPCSWKCSKKRSKKVKNVDLGPEMLKKGSKKGQKPQFTSRNAKKTSFLAGKSQKDPKKSKK